jgi:hypothetical protein
MNQPRKKFILASKSKCTIPLMIPVDGKIEIVPVDCSIAKSIKRLVEMGHQTRASCSGLASEHPKNYGIIFHVGLKLPRINKLPYKACLTKSAFNAGLTISRLEDVPDSFVLLGEEHTLNIQKVSPDMQIRNIMRLNRFVTEVEKNECAKHIIIE